MRTNGSILIVVFLSIVFFICGYIAYPIINDKSDYPFPLIEGYEQSTDNLFIGEAPDQDNARIAAQILSTNNEAAITKVNTTPINSENRDAENLADQQDRVKSSKTLTHEMIEDFKPTAEQNSFKQWQINNKDKIRQELANFVPDSMLPRMLEAIQQDDYFSDLKAPTRAEIDEQWAIDMELRIKDLITLHELGNLVEIADLSCQLNSCRIAGSSTEMMAWNTINVHLMMTLAQKGFLPDQSNAKTGVSFIDNDGTGAYFYNQYAFTLLK